MLKNRRARPRTIAARRKLRRVFKRVMLIYETIRSNEGAKSCDALYRALGRGGGARPAYSRKRVTTEADYVIDVDLAAKHALGPDSEEFAYYCLRFLRGDEDAGGGLKARFLNSVAERVAQEIKRRGLHDLHHYFAHPP